MFYRFDPSYPRDHQAHHRVLNADAYKVGDLLHVDVDAPGVDLEDIDIEVEKKQLTVTVERRDLLDGERTDLVRGRPVGTFVRRFFLSDSLDGDSIEASYDRGVLRLTIPVKETAKARKIAVTSSVAGELEG